ncbi:hypothetical protein T439DRAFT_327936 [Meredithblackwellia eburnea MCA 4105]
MITPSNLSLEKVDFLNRFYTVSDDSDPAAVEKYLAFLTKDVKFTMGLASMTGEDAVRKMRENMWGGVATRKHTVHKVYTSDPEASELMLFGTVDYGLRNGKSVTGVGWAGRIVFAAGPELKMQEYQVWLDVAPLTNALKA